MFFGVSVKSYETNQKKLKNWKKQTHPLAVRKVSNIQFYQIYLSLLKQKQKQKKQKKPLHV